MPPNEAEGVHPLVQHVLFACVSALRLAGREALLPFHEASLEADGRPDWTCTLPKEAYANHWNACLHIEAKVCKADPNVLKPIWEAVW